MELPAFEIEQHGKKLYLTYMTPKQLASDSVRADVWSPHNPEGYQRGLEQPRARLFRRFIQNEENISPPAILLSVRVPIEFRRKDGNFGVLEIPEWATLYEVDGQHRIAGLRQALSKVSALPVTLPVIIVCPVMLGITQEDEQRYFEAKLFVIINRTQKRVRVDLSDRFIARLPPDRKAELEVLGTPEQLERTRTAVEAADILRGRSGSVWEGQIQHPTGGPGIVSQRTFTASLDFILKDDKFSGMSAEDLAESLDNYWSAWADLCPSAFDSPDGYVIQKSTGVNVLHRLFVEVAKWLDDLGEEWTKEKFHEVLENMTQGNVDEYWSSGPPGVGTLGSGQKVFRRLAEQLRDAFRSGNIDALRK